MSKASRLSQNPGGSEAAYELVTQRNLLQLRQRRPGDPSPAGAVLVFIFSPELIVLVWRYIQITSCQTTKMSGRQKLLLLRASTTNGLEPLSLCESSTMASLSCTSVRGVDADEDVRAFFKPDKVPQCSPLLLSSLIKPVHPPPGTNTLSSYHCEQCVPSGPDPWRQKLTTTEKGFRLLSAAHQQNLYL